MPGTDSKDFVVAIGASAGGLEAYTQFFDNARENKHLSYILIQHLSPDHKSLLVDLLAKHTHMKVVEAENNMRIEKNRIYVIPPKKHMTVVENKLQLTDKDPSDKSPTTVIDTFFYSLANAYEDKAIAVVLSGTGTDGSRGIEAIKEFGGLVIAQEPASAKFDGMPKSSIDTGNVDMVLPSEQIYNEIVNYINHIPTKEGGTEKVDEVILNDILDVVMMNTGCDFKQYKLATVLRRLNRRLAFLKIPSEEKYLSYLKSNPVETKIFCKELLIGVTKFFRDREAYEALKTKVLIPLVDSKNNFESVKIWVTACSTGEEVYSIAMVLNDIIRKKNKKLDVKIFGTDLDATHIDKASRGEYGRFIAKEIPPEYLEEYFLKKDNTYIIAPEIRRQIVFAKHNVAADSPFIKNDLICCRNMLIYMNVHLQKRILAKFHFGLNNNGYLFLGSSESIGSNDNFNEIDRKWKIFRKNMTLGTNPMLYNLSESTHPSALARKKQQGNFASFRNEGGLPESVNSMLLNDFSIAAVYIDRNYIITETIGNYKKYLILPDQGLKFNLLKMLPDAVSIALNTAIIKAWKHEQDDILDRIYCTINGQSMSLVISIKPEALAGLTLIGFNSTPWQGDLSPIEDEQTPQDLDKNAGRLINNLRKELQESRFNLQTAIEELETTNEELQSSNEELLSSNEELQSSNEELQSLNEELHTLNAEHQLRIHELIELNDDLNNYFRCSDIGQIIIDKSLLVRKFNPAASKLINLIEQDIGRSITHLTVNFDYPRFEKDILDVLKSGEVMENEVITNQKRNLLIRIQPYIRKDKIVDGAVLSFVDISKFKELNSIINGVFEASKSAILVLEAIRNNRDKIQELALVTSNAFAAQLFGKNMSAYHMTLPLIHKDLSDLVYADLIHVIETGDSFDTELGINGKWFNVTAVKMMNGVILTLNDISQRKQAEDKMKQSYSELYSVKEKLKSLNQNLEDIVAERTRELSESEERFRLVSSVTNDALIDWNFMDNSIWVSENFGRLFGYKKTEIKLNRDFWLSKVHPADRYRVERSIHESINSGKTSWTQQYRYLDSSNHYRVINDRAYFILDENGTPYRMLSSMLDITELKNAERDLKESEMRFRLALDGAEMAGWDIDLNNDKLMYSQKLPAIFGRAYSDNFTAMLLRSQFHPDDKKKVQHVYEEALKGAPYEYEARIVWPNGSIHWIRTSGNVLFDEHGKPARMIGITRETTKDKNIALALEEKVKERTQELSKSNSDLEQFAYIASHDLQEPLRKIQTFISLLLQRKNRPELSEQYLQKISSSAARMSSLIRNVLDFSRLSQTREGIVAIDLNNIVNQLLIDFELSIKERNVRISLDKLPVIPGIPHQIGQLFHNLISNAIKFSLNNPVVQIRARNLTPLEIQKYPELNKNNAYTCITISDNGIGFDQKFSEKIFTFFYRLESSKDYSGNGIGLALCKKIVDNHKGCIFANSNPGKGAEFTVILPLNGA